MKRFITYFALLLSVALTAVTLTACGDDDDDENTDQTWNYSLTLSEVDGSIEEANQVLTFFQEKIPAALGVDHNMQYFQLSGTYSECRTKIANAFASLYTQVNAQGWTGYYTVQVVCMNNSQTVVLYTINK